MRIFPSIHLSHTPSWSEKRAVEGEKLASECNFARTFRKNAYSQLSTVPTQLFWNHIRNETAETAEYAWNMRDETVTNAGISSYSGLERWDSSPGPSIFRGIFRNTKFWRTLYIPKEIPEYLVDAKVRRYGQGTAKVRHPIEEMRSARLKSSTQIYFYRQLGSAPTF